MHFRPVEQSMDDEYLTQGGGGDAGQGAALEDRPRSRGVYFSLDDVFWPDESGMIPGENAVATPWIEPENPPHPSDMRRLELEHTTAGYREGISAAKDQTIQAGFDEGFSLGATIGLVAGQLLGTLEGIENALSSRPDGDEEAAEASKLLAEAREDFSVTKIFSSDYWAPDGNWTYDVEETDEGDEVLFPDVAKAHPLIRKWTDIVDERVKLWNIDRSLLDGEDGEDRMEAAADDATAGAGTIALPPATSRQRLEW
ncbi:hypothetical protein TrVFT333_001969 [Trichoderma virens FT-333]|nr:hypothetical protein TrVFT333_001969 [Trichoderma virens FT-333]